MGRSRPEFGRGTRSLRRQLDCARRVGQRARRYSDPQIDAPVGSYYGTSPCNPVTLGFLTGLYVPFDAATLAKLYPTHDAYVAAVTASANQAVADGFMLLDDAQTLVSPLRTMELCLLLRIGFG